MTAQDSSSSDLAPGFLVASPALGDPNFRGSLVLMAEHSAEGSFGLVVNRESPVSVRELLETVSAELAQAAHEAGRDGGMVLRGGPVDPERLWILHRPEGEPAEGAGERLSAGVALGGSRALLERLARSPGGGPFLLVLGYAGWGPRQLETEVGHGSWIPLPLHEDLVLALPLRERWDAAVRLLGLEPGGFMVSGGGAEA